MAKNRTHIAQKATTTFSPARTVSQLQPKGFGLPQIAAQESAGFSASRVSPFPPVQAKLTVGAPNDKYEQEADAVAAKVVERINSPSPPTPPPANPSGTGAVQRQAALEAEYLQQKPLAESIQRQTAPEEEKLQQKPQAELQRQAAEPEEEALQAKPGIQQQAIAEEEPLQQQPLQRKGGGAIAAPMPVESTIAGARGQGQGLDNATRGKMEGAFGTDFSSVRVHTDERADGLNRSLQSRAFATGQDIFFKRGEFNPGSRGGQELLAHELTHVVQQSSMKSKRGSPSKLLLSPSSRSVQRKPGSKKLKLKKQLDEIEKRYKSMILAARKKGKNVAADNLERFLKGTGGTKKISVAWLRGFSEVINAERTNQERFEATLSKKSEKLKVGKTIKFSDFWDRQLTASIFNELYYASGTSTIHSVGNFQLRRKGNLISISGTVNHRWYDPYDWHAGLGALIPGTGFVSDSDALLLKKHRGAKDFLMESTWSQTVVGEVKIIDWWPDSEKYSWKGP